MSATDEQWSRARSFDCLIVGAGHAGAETAVSLRQLGFDGTVGLVGDEAVPPYERPAISKEYLAGKKDFEQLLLRPFDYWDEHNVSLLLSTRVVDVDPSRRTVVCEDGEVLGYRSLVWATGGTPRRLTCPGSDLPGVRTLRGKADCDDLLSVLPSTQRFVVVGGGYVGLEAAAVLRELGREVAVVEALDRVLARVAGEPVSRFFEQEHRAHGVDLYLGAGVSEVVGHDGRVEAVRLTDGTLIEAEQVIVGIGMEPVAGPLIAAGAAPGPDGRGVLVDTVCKSSLEDVYCVGDCSVMEGGIRIESRQNATEQARAAALAICGRPEPLQMLPWFWSNQYDLKLQTVGLSHGHDQLVVRGRPEDRSFSVAYLKDGALVALDCINATRDYLQGRKLVEASARIAPDLLADATRSLKELATTARATQPSPIPQSASQRQSKEPDMKFSLTTREGLTQEIEGRDGLSIMQNIRNAGIEELQAICGGCLSCATCHVYVDEAPVPDALGERSRDEQDLLEASDFMESNSRLSCQLVFGPNLEGIQVTIAPED